MSKQRRVPSVRPPPVRPPPAAGRPKNRLLAGLPADDFHRLLPHLTTVTARIREVVQKQGEPIRHVYFPNGGVWSITTLLSTGATVEAATVGDEGLLGIEAFFGEGLPAAGETFLQVPDTNVERLSVEHFREEIARRGALHDAVGHFAHVVLAQMMQSTACNALHSVEERCCRWLLTTHDRMHQQDFNLSHEFLATMLGARRPTVTAVAGTLQAAGLIRYTHGHVTVLDRKGLEAAACECYSILRAHYDRLFV
jgi:CRP-like cAMP-binding protein